MVRRMTIMTVTAVILAACGGGGGTRAGGTPSGHGMGETCSPKGTQLEVIAKSTTFDASCLAAPAGTAFSIVLDNQDPNIQHNVAILAEDPDVNPNAKVLFRGELFPGVAQKTYNVGPLAAGEYHFHCDSHPGPMKGSFVVE